MLIIDMKRIDLIVIWQSLILINYRIFFRHLADIIGKKFTTSLVIPTAFVEGGGQSLTCDAITASESTTFKHLLIAKVLSPHVQIVWFRGLSRFFRLFDKCSPSVLCIAEPYSLTALGCYLVARLRFHKKFLFYTYTAQNIYKNFPWPLSAIQKFILQKSHAVLVCGTTQREVLMQHNSSVRMIDFPLWFDETIFYDRKLKPNSILTIGFAGSLTEEKGVLNFIKIVPQLKSLFPHSQFKIVGRGELAKSVCEKALKIGIEFTEGLPPSEMPEFYSSLDLLVVPSLTRTHWREQFGRVIIEAKACGTSVVGSDSGEIPFVINNVECIFKENDLNDFINACMINLEKIIENKNLVRLANSNWALKHYSASGLAHKLASQLVFENNL